MGDIVGNIQPFKDGLLDEKKPCILAGLEYDTPWTRDTAINVWNGAGLIFPQAALNTLLSVLERRGGKVFIGGQYWDAVIWVTGAWAYYLYTGNRTFLSLALEAAKNSLEAFEKTEFNPATGLFRGPACYGDGVAAYPDRYARTQGSSSILEWPRCNPSDAAPTGYGIPMQTLSTNCLYYQAYQLAGDMARELSQSPDPTWNARAEQLKTAIQHHLWDEKLGRYLYLTDPWGNCDHQEGLGNCFAVLFGIASERQAEQVIQNQTITPQGIPCVWPTFQRYQKNEMDFARHAGTVWPHVQGFWAEVTARAAERYPTAAQAFEFELLKLSELAVRHGQFAELYHPISGEIYGGVQEGAQNLWHSCHRQTWSATAYVRMILMGLLGMEFSPQGIELHPHIPQNQILPLELNGLRYQKQTIYLSVNGTGNQIAEFRLNGELQEEPFLPSSLSGRLDCQIILKEG